MLRKMKGSPKGGRKEIKAKPGLGRCVLIFLLLRAIESIVGVLLLTIVSTVCDLIEGVSNTRMLYLNFKYSIGVGMAFYTWFLYLPISAIVWGHVCMFIRLTRLRVALANAGTYFVIGSAILVLIVIRGGGSYFDLLVSFMIMMITVANFFAGYHLSERVLGLKGQ